MTHWMFRCQEVSQKVSQSMDTALPLHQRVAIRMHLWMCRYCARFRRQLGALRKLSRHLDKDLPTTGKQDTLSPEARKRIKRALKG